VGLVSRAIEGEGIPTVTLAMERRWQRPGGLRAVPVQLPDGGAGSEGPAREVALAALALLHELDEPGEVDLPFD
jgi:hypothetical protein